MRKVGRLLFRWLNIRALFLDIGWFHIATRDQICETHVESTWVSYGFAAENVNELESALGEYHDSEDEDGVVIEDQVKDFVVANERTLNVVVSIDLQLSYSLESLGFM